MTIGKNESFFNGLEIKIYSEIDGISDKYAYKIMVDYDDEENGLTIAGKFKDLMNDPQISDMQALVIGSWEEAFDMSPDDLFTSIIENSDKLQNLKALFIGEMTFEECEMSWINQGNYTEILNSFKGLEVLRVRGANGLKLGSVNHRSLKTLIIESGGLDSEVIMDLIKSNLPSLKHLELWLGVEDYGFNGDLKTLKPLFDNPFPNITYLGIKNSEIVDNVASYLANHAILEKIDTLDLSLGTMTDVGGEALLSGSKVNSLKKLDLHHHFMSAGMMKKLTGLSIDVDITNKNEDEDDWRYVYVSE
ncbi:MAG: hypothetical protein GY714_07620 [Desulfobacterales bacterium]|nr:hypothetical protein [Desulfobacterales bacterium]